MTANTPSVRRRTARKGATGTLRMIESGLGKARRGEVRFGSALLKVGKADARELAQNVSRGQAALTRAMKALVKPGVKLKRTKGVALYAADPERPDVLVRILDGKRERGVFDKGEFKVLT